ncbi:MAG: ATP-binding cassette domain-containing protein [Steroidobacteraceae bacterium]
MSADSRRQCWRGVLRVLGREITPYVRRRLAEVLGLVALGAAMNALAPLALKGVVDGLAGQQPIEVPLGFLIGLYAASQWLGRSSAEVRALRYAQAERRILRTLSERVFAHVLRLPLRFHLQRQTGAVSQAIDNGLEGVRLILHHLVFTVLPVCAELAIVAMVLARLGQPVFLVLFCGAAVCYAALFGRSAGRIAESARTASAARVAAGALITDGLLNCETVKSFGAEELVAGKAGGALERNEHAWLAFHRRYCANGLAVAGVFAAFLTATLACALHSVRAGELTVGGFVLVNTYMLQLVRPAEMLGFAVQGFAQGAAMLGRTLELLAERPEASTGLALGGGPGGALRFERVTLAYGPGRAALEDLTFEIPAGATLGIVGQSGSGKSSIVRLLLRLVEPDGGLIRLDGRPLRAIAPAALRAAIAVVPQDTALLDDTIENNIALAWPQAEHRDIVQAARVAQLEEFIESLPQGYATVVGERGVRLSGGERQRIAIARAALRRPLLYVFDEATAALDGRTEQAVLAGLQTLSGTATTVIIAHRLVSVARADRIVVLHAGRLVESGGHAELIQAAGHYAALWHAQHPDAAAA